MTQPGVPPLPALLSPLAVGLCASVLCACLVTEKIEYGEKNVPANLLAVSPASFSRVPPAPDPRCDPSAGTLPGSGDSDTSEDVPWMPFEVHVSDPNVTDRLVGHVLVNGVRDYKSSLSEIPASGVADRGVVQFCLSERALSRPCSHVEFLVSRGFGSSGERTTLEPGDLATVDWWVLGPAANFSLVSANDCEMDLPDAGVP